MAIESPVKNESFGLTSPEFDCGKFTMVFSKEPKGFEVVTDQTFPRRPNNTPLPLTPGQGTTLRIGMQNQMGFTTGNLAKEALDVYRKNPTEANLKAYQERRSAYQDRFSIVVGLRNFRRDQKDSNKLIMDIKPTNFPVTSNFSNLESSDELLNLASNSSTTLILETGDGKGILQHRSAQNTGWADTPSASASGYFDNIPFQKEENGKPSKRRRQLRKITTVDVKKNALRELEGELGIKTVTDKGKPIIKDTDVVIGAMVHEKDAVHDEFLVMAKTSFSAEEVLAEAAKVQKNEKLHDEEFREKYVVIDCTPETIMKLLTQVKCPIPYSHCAAWVTKGYQKMLERSSRKETEAWKKQAEKGVKDNYAQIDAIVAKDLQEHPEKLTTFPPRMATKVEANIKAFMKSRPNAKPEEIEAERQKQITSLPKRNTKGYSPFYHPDEQGLPSFTSEMKRVGLIS